VARRVGMVSVEDAFAAGLLHDLGMLLLHNGDPDRYAALLAAAPHLGAAAEAEREEWGFDHSGVGAAVVVHWNLPERMVQVVGSVHYVDRAAADGEALRRLVACVALADDLCAELGKAVLPAPAGSDGSDALRFRNGQIALDELRQLAAQNLGAAAITPM